jgi:hypothetical protein
MTLIEFCYSKIEQLQITTIITILVLFFFFMMYLFYLAMTQDYPSNLFFTTQQQHMETEKMGLMVPPKTIDSWKSYFKKNELDRFEIKIINQDVATIAVDVPLHQVDQFNKDLKQMGAIGLRAE